MYLTNETTEEVGEFGLLQDGWRESTQEEIDAYLLDKAKGNKLAELKSDFAAFQEAGYEYTGTIVCDNWSDATTYEKYALVWDVATSLNYESLQDDNLDNAPETSPEYWQVFNPTFKTDQCCMINLSVQDGVDEAEENKYKYFDCPDSNDVRREINFDDATNWLAFTKAIRKEEDRIMKKYNNYRSEIAKCSTAAEVEAISIDFSA